MSNPEKDSASVKNKKAPKEKKGFYFFMSGLIKLVMSVFLGFKLTTDPEVKKWKKSKTPFIMLCAHPSELDAALLLIALYPRYARIVCGARQLYKGSQGKIFRKMNVIPKLQFTADLEAVREMIATVKKGDVLAFMPEGRVSMDGTPNPIDIAAAKLIKKLKCPAAVFIPHGSYFVKPPYHRTGMQRGRVSGEVKCLVTADEAAALSAEQIQEKLLSVIDYNIPEEIKNNPRPFGKKNAPRMQDVSRLFYYCPVCGAKYSVTDDGDTIRCASCGTVSQLTREQVMKPVSTGDGAKAFPEDIASWNRLQRTYEAKRWADPTAELRFTVTKTVQVLTDPNPAEPSGTGKLSLTRERLLYTDDTDTVEVPMANLDGMSADYMLGNVVLYRGDIMWMFSFDDPRNTAELMNAWYVLHTGAYEA